MPTVARPLVPRVCLVASDPITPASNHPHLMRERHYRRRPEYPVMPITVRLHCP
jgi:hypothetical protein